jgi:hypothetical protein
MQAKIATARFYAEHILTKAPGQADPSQAPMRDGAAAEAF